MRKTWLGLGIIAAAFAASPVLAQDAAKTIQDGVYTIEQADRGAELIGESCALCHGNAMRGSPAGPSVMSGFFDKWGSKPLSDLYAYISTEMPLDNPGGLAPDDYVDITARILALAGAPEGTETLTSDETALSKITIADKAK
ncbi:MAG: cytochrome c [Devosia nanyangense]|nr:cytochrome c [Devosia nanyangense]